VESERGATECSGGPNDGRAVHEVKVRRGSKALVPTNGDDADTDLALALALSNGAGHDEGPSANRRTVRFFGSVAVAVAVFVIGVVRAVLLPAVAVVRFHIACLVQGPVQGPVKSDPKRYKRTVD